jgi:hypothetical protein
MDIGGLVYGWSWCRTEAEVKGKAKGATDSRYATDDISSADGFMPQYGRL